LPQTPSGGSPGARPGPSLRSCGSIQRYNPTVRTMRPVHDRHCSVACTAELIGSKWTAVIVHDLSEGPRRFSELERSCPGISPRTLAERLRVLEHEGVVERRSYAESPPRVEYELTERGRGLLPIIDAMRDFGREWLVPEHGHLHAGSAHAVGLRA
jgi:DNA-binding HxlR family transcriptional regulator